MPVFTHTAAHGQLTIDGQDFMTEFSRVRNLQVLGSTPPLRGNDVIIPQVDGRRARRRRQDSSQFTLAVWVAGTDIDDMWDNIAALQTVTGPPATGITRTVVAELGTITRTGQGHVRMDVGDMVGPSIVACALDLTIVNAW